MSSNRAHGEVYSIQHYVIKFVSDLWQFGGFRQILQFLPLKKMTALTEILLIVALITITLTPNNLKVFGSKSGYHTNSFIGNQLPNVHVFPL